MSVAKLFADVRVSVRECDCYLGADAAAEAVAADFGPLSAEERAWLVGVIEEALQQIEDAREFGRPLTSPTLPETRACPQ